MPDRINVAELWFLAIFVHAVVAVVGALTRDLTTVLIGCFCVAYDAWWCAFWARRIGE